MTSSAVFLSFLFIIACIQVVIGQPPPLTPAQKSFIKGKWDAFFFKFNAKKSNAEEYLEPLRQALFFSPFIKKNQPPVDKDVEDVTKFLHEIEALPASISPKELYDKQALIGQDESWTVDIDDDVIALFDDLSNGYGCLEDVSDPNKSQFSCLFDYVIDRFIGAFRHHYCKTCNPTPGTLSEDFKYYRKAELLFTVVIHFDKKVKGSGGATGAHQGPPPGKPHVLHQIDSSSCGIWPYVMWYGGLGLTGFALGSLIGYASKQSTNRTGNGTDGPPFPPVSDDMSDIVLSIVLVLIIVMIVVAVLYYKFFYEQQQQQTKKTGELKAGKSDVSDDSKSKSSKSGVGGSSTSGLSSTTGTSRSVVPTSSGGSSSSSSAQAKDGGRARSAPPDRKPPGSSPSVKRSNSAPPASSTTGVGAKKSTRPIDRPLTKISPSGPLLVSGFSGDKKKKSPLAAKSSASPKDKDNEKTKKSSKDDKSKR